MKRIAILPIFNLVTVLTIVLLTASCSLNWQTQATVPVTIGITYEESVGLLYLAQDRNFFIKNGLSVNLKRFDSGVSAISGMVKGEADIGLMSEYPVVVSAFQKQPISIITNVNKSELVSMVGLRDHGIENIADLQGKRVGVTKQTTAEFYLGRFLELNGMNSQDVTLVDLKTTQLVEAVSNGSVDALIGAESYIEQIKEKQGDNLVIWPANINQPVFTVLVAMNNWIEQHPELVRQLLNALVQAESYLIQHPDKARAIIQANLKSDDAFMAGVWKRNRYALSLDYSLIAVMNDEAHWTISENLTTEKAIPNFKEYIYIGGLQAVKPEAVGIVK